MSEVDLIKAIAVAAELCNKNISEGAIEFLLDELKMFPQEHVFKSLRKVAKSGQFSLENIISNIDDGRVGVEEAWGMVHRLGESDSIVWTDEMSAAYFVAQPLLSEGDKIAARMAFKEKYTALVDKNRSDGVPAKWTASLGNDQQSREDVLAQAVSLGRLNADSARILLPASSYKGSIKGKKLLNHIVDTKGNAKKIAKIKALID